jgi:AAA+ ATPase superfamily predicted ATPase
VRFLDRADELRRLDAVLAQPGAFAAIWGRRRVGKTRLLIEWSQRHDGLYAAADPSAPAVQRRYLAGAVERRFPGFADVEYPDWRSFLLRLTREAERSGWPGPFVLDELPYLIAADPSVAGILQNWLDGQDRRPCLVVSGSSRHMMHGAALTADAPLYGRAVEAFAVRPLRPGYLADVFTAEPPRALVSAYALWGGMPRYWELAEPYGGDLAAAVDELVLDPSGPLHEEPDRLLRAGTPPATALRPLLDAIGAGADRISEIAGRLGKPASSL